MLSKADAYRQCEQTGRPNQIIGAIVGEHHGKKEPTIKSELEHLLDQLAEAIEFAEIQRLELDSRLTPISLPLGTLTCGQTNQQSAPEPSRSPIGGRLARLAERVQSLGSNLEKMRQSLAV